MALEDLTKECHCNACTWIPVHGGASVTRRGSDDHALVTARLRGVLLQRGLVLEQNLRYCLWPMVMHTMKGHGGAICRAV